MVRKTKTKTKTREGNEKLIVKKTKTKDEWS